MAKVEVQIKGIDALLQKFDNIKRIDLRNKMNELTTFVHAQAVNLAPRDTGNLAESIHMEVKESESKIQGRVYTNVQYAKYVEFGTGKTGKGTYRYKIKGLKLQYKDKGWCYWDEKEGKFIYTNGQEAQPYMYPAIRRNRKHMKAILTRGIKEKLKEVCNKGGQ